MNCQLSVNLRKYEAKSLLTKKQKQYDRFRFESG